MGYRGLRFAIDEGSSTVRRDSACPGTDQDKDPPASPRPPIGWPFADHRGVRPPRFVEGWRYELINEVLVVSPIPSRSERDPNDEIGYAPGL